MKGRQVGRVNQQSKGETPLMSGVLQRAAVRAVADKEVEATEEVDQGTLRGLGFVHDFSEVKIDRGGLPKEASKTSNQTGLPDDLKAGVENLSGYSLDHVRVHYNSPKPAQLQAYAYTQGTEIHVAPGQGKYLPHEAWHVVQQMQGRVKPMMQMKGVQINEDQGMEKEADVMGAKAGQRKLHKQDKTNLTRQIFPPLHNHQKVLSLFSNYRAQNVVYQLQTRIYYAPPNNRPGNSGINAINHVRSLHNTTQRDLAAYHSGYADSAAAIANGAMICNHHVSYAAIAQAIRDDIFTNTMNQDLDGVIDWVNTTYNPNRLGNRPLHNGNFGFQFGGMPPAHIPNLGTLVAPEYDEFTVESEIDDIIWNLANDPDNLFYWPTTTGGDPDSPTGLSNSPLAGNTVTQISLTNNLDNYRQYLQNNLNLNVP